MVTDQMQPKINNFKIWNQLKRKSEKIDVKFKI